MEGEERMEKRLSTARFDLYINYSVDELCPFRPIVACRYLNTRIPLRENIEARKYSRYNLTTFGVT